MIGRKTMMRYVGALLGISLSLALYSVRAYADAERTGQPVIYGKTYGAWAAQWWQWALTGPDGKNAVQDETGEFCAVHQPADTVWFLAGTFGRTGVERTCTIPPQRALFYPLVNTLWTDCPGTADEDLTNAEVRGILTNTIGGDLACHLASTLDGVAISNLRVLTVRTQSPRFSSILPRNHVNKDACDPPLPRGKTGRQITEGYWVMLPPLSPGEHVLTLHGSACDAAIGEVQFTSEVTYRLTVLAASAYAGKD